MRTATMPRRDRRRPSPRIVPHGPLLVVLLGVAVAVVVMPGCSLWSSGTWSERDPWGRSTGTSSDEPEKNRSDSPLTHQRTSSLTHQSRDTVSLAVDFRHIPSSALGESMWRSIDETAFDASVRQAWLANGLRIGLLHGTGDGSPAGAAASSIGMADAVNELFAGTEILGGQADGREVIPLRPSRRHEMPLGPALAGTQTLLFKQTGGVVGMGLDNPQFLLALTAENGPRQGQSTLSIRPEIQHGSVRQKFVSSDTAVRIQAGRDRWPLSGLDLTWVTHPGSILVIAPVVQPDEAEPTFGLGRQVLRDPDHLTDDQHIVTFLQVEP